MDEFKKMVAGFKKQKLASFYEILRALKHMETQDHVKGFYCDFSTSGKGGKSPQFGLSHLQELHAAFSSLREAKEKRLGVGVFKMIAYTDTFESQFHVR